MNSRRLLAALLIALLLSGGVTYVVARKLVPRPGTSAVTQHYVAASRALEAGEVLKAEDLTLIEWPAAKPLPGAFAKVTDLEGRAVIYPVFPGSHVDVLVTFRTDRFPTPATQIVLQDVEVLTVGQKLEPEPQGKAEAVNVVTLLLTPEDAQKMVLASSQGGIQFVLRNGADHTRVVATPMQVAQLSGSEPAAAPAVTPRPHLPMKEPYVVETILGDKHSTRSFE